jgi:dihydropteroate synthase
MMIWTARHHAFTFPRPALVMGILNVTPDSFSDGGRYLSVEHAVARGLSLVDEGADLLDVGGESTRPGAAMVSEQEELQRVLPVVTELVRRLNVPVSIDTMKPAVAAAALQCGASVVNDVAANRDEDSMWRVVAEAGAGYVCMHMQGNPRTMQEQPQYGDVVQEARRFFEDRLDGLARAGVKPEQVVLDVGIGFGKTVEHNLKLLGAMQGFTTLSRPMLLGASRKSFIGKVLGIDIDQRVPASLACVCIGVQQGVNILRVHDVAATVQAVRMTEAILERTRH